MVIMNQAWIGYAATTHQPPSLSGLWQERCVSRVHQASSLWLCRVEQVLTFKVVGAGKESDEHLRSSLDQTRSDNATLLPVTGQN